MTEAEEYLKEQDVIFDKFTKDVLIDKYILVSLLNGFAGKQLKKLLEDTKNTDSKYLPMYISMMIKDDHDG